MLGRHPIRQTGTVKQGAYPKKGWKNRNVWEGLIPRNELPYVINPEKGYLVSGNNIPTSVNA